MAIIEKKNIGNTSRVAILLQTVVRRWLFKYAIVRGFGLVIVVVMVIVCRMMWSYSPMPIPMPMPMPLPSASSRTGNSADNDSDMNYSSLRRQKKKTMKTKRKKKKNNIALRPLELRPDADKWKAMTRDDMHEELKCNYEKDLPIHDPDTWIGMREAYISIVGKERATVEEALENDDDDDAVAANVNTNTALFETAFRVPFEIRQSPGMGRGIFAKGNFKKGEILYDFSKSAQFWDGSEFAEFLRILQPELACDVLMWSYTQYFGEGELSSEDSEDFESQKSNLRIITDLDPGCFCNNGSLEKGNMAWLNSEGNIAAEVGDSPKPVLITRKNGSVRQDTVKSAPLVAVRDIEAGEELLCMYGQFSEGLNLMIE